MKTYVLKAYGEEHTVMLGKSCYANNNSLAIQMKLCNQELWDTLTTNLDILPMNHNCAFVRRDKYADFVVENNLGRRTGRVAQSGFCDYDEFEFFEDIYYM